MLELSIVKTAKIANEDEVQIYFSMVKCIKIYKWENCFIFHS